MKERFRPSCFQDCGRFNCINGGRNSRTGMSDGSPVQLRTSWRYSDVLFSDGGAHCAMIWRTV